MEKLIITAAVTGGEYVSKETTPYVPSTVDEIVAEARALIGLDLLVDEERARWSDVFDERESAPVNCHSYIDWAAERVLDTIKENKP